MRILEIFFKNIFLAPLKKERKSTAAICFIDTKKDKRKHLLTETDVWSVRRIIPLCFILVKTLINDSG